MKKRILALLLAAALSAALLAGCGSQPAAETEEPAAAGETAAAESEPEVTEEAQGVEVDLGALLDEAVPLAGAPTLSTVLNPVASGTAVKENASASLDYSNAKDGYVMVKWLAGGTPKLKVLVKGPSGTTYQYNLRADGQYDTFPLSDGNGNMRPELSSDGYVHILPAAYTVWTDVIRSFASSN